MQPRLIKNFHAEDSRGSFTKVFSDLQYDDIEINFKESYFSKNKPGVWRGLHFQTPPMEHWKLVTVVQGKIKDYVVDIRKNSSTYGERMTFELEAGKDSLLIPPGYAHGFFSYEDSIVLYNVSSVHSPDHDKGLSYKYLGKKFQAKEVLMSPRDLCFPEDLNEISIDE